MGRRTDLQSLLELILGSRNVYYQPPSSVKMKYPAIVYSRENFNIRSANNGKYIVRPGYSVTLIDSDPDSDIVSKLLMLPFCSFTRHYTSDGMNHDVFRIFY